GTEPCRKMRLHMHQASPLVLAFSPLLRSVRSTRVTVGDGSRFSRARSQLAHDYATAKPRTLALPLLERKLPWEWLEDRAGEYLYGIDPALRPPPRLSKPVDSRGLEHHQDQYCARAP